MKAPKRSEVKELRETYGLSQSAAAAIAYSTLRTWQNWEAGTVSMHPAIWAWFKHEVTSQDKKPDQTTESESSSRDVKYIRHDIQFWWNARDNSIHVTAPYGSAFKVHSRFINDPESGRWNKTMFGWMAKMLRAEGKPAPKE